MSEKIEAGQSRKTWIEPEVIALAVTETAIRPDRGRDGETRWTDCTS